jgi:ABC-2 type transport system ATP-binding protein
VAVDEVSFDVNDGEIFGLIGPERRRQDHDHGMRRGPARPDRGTITVLGLDPARDVYQLQSASACSFSKRNCRSASRCGKPCTLGGAVRQSGAERNGCSSRSVCRASADAWFMTLSGGQKQRLFVLLALINDPTSCSSMN